MNANDLLTRAFVALTLNLTREDRLELRNDIKEYLEQAMPSVEEE